ncbi:flagellar motor switch phosphatase FliY [Paenisporosarcina sp. TG-14]|uniref:flagellar motor switch phosphatase FliY n=1 Tax=Paenisporosarcina sp. TG-14 TaxID=1231057 RepID=UPI000308617E|nr:flagellar motor switch phosphatase FliY [Paenisporosarcina sp. TG-14]
MTINKLSPDEINGLLGLMEKKNDTMSENSLSTVEKEAITELLNVSLGSSSAILSLLFSEQVNVMTSEVSIKQKDDLFTTILSPFFVVLGEYTGGINGIQILAINKADVQTITKIIDVNNEVDGTKKQFKVLQDVVQQMFSSVSQSMATVLDQEVSHSLSGIDVIETQQDFPMAKFTEEQWFVEIEFQLTIGSQNTVNFHLCIPVRLAKQIVGILTDSMDEEFPEETYDMPFQSFNQSNTANKTKDSGSKPNVQSVQFSSFDETISTNSQPNNLNMLLDIPLQVTVELGRTKRLVKEILEVSQGSIIELDKLAGEPVDILINNKLIAVGEVVVIDENFGVRVTDILSTADRISKLR